MRYNPALKADIPRFLDYVMIVEGKKDVAALEALGFERVYALHMNGVPLRERVEQIVAQLDRKKDKVCILTDFDKRGKQLYMNVKPIFQELGIKLDSTFRGILLKAQVSHIEGLATFMGKVDRIG